MTAKEIRATLPPDADGYVPHLLERNDLFREAVAQLAELNEALRSALTLEDLPPQKKKPGGPSLPLWHDPDLERPR